MIIAAIPVKNQLRWTAPLIESLLIGDEIDELWIYDNGSTDDTRYWVSNRMKTDSRLKYRDCKNVRIYDMWNHMIKKAAEIGNVKLAILNNDIRLPFMAIKTMAENMKHYKIAAVDTSRRSFDPIDSVETVDLIWQHRVGFAFMVDADFWKDKEYAIHPDFILWWGDDDLFRRCQLLGGDVCRMVGIGIDHGLSQTDPEYSGSKLNDIELDRLTFIRIWS
jgi:glycosyltransferase involved in cell wall biosynthesis